MLTTMRPRQRGFTLIEILVGLTIGLVLLLGLATFLANSLVGNAGSRNMAMVNQQLRSAMTLMARDLRRAGYRGSPNFTTGALASVGAGATYSNPFAALSPNASGNCILFAYDANSSGAIDTAAPGKPEYYGFRLNTAAGSIEYYSGYSTGDCSTNAGWAPLTDANTSQFVAIGGTPTFSVATSDPVYMSGTSGPNIKVRQVTIRLKAQSRGDPLVAQTLEQTVKLENDLFSGS